MLVTVSVSNIIGIVLMLMIITTNGTLFLKGTKTRFLVWMIVLTMVTCFSDIVAYAIDGLPGVFVTVMIYLVNSWLYLAVIMVSYFWVRFLVECIGVKMSRTAKWMIRGIDLLGLLALVINVFYPLVFTAPDNVYERQGLYFIFVAIGGFNIVYGLIQYYITKKRGGLMVPFSVSAFIVPMVAAITVQSLFYGISVVWVGVAIALTGLVSSLKNELIYVDQLTGVYNRYYLEKIKDEIVDTKNEVGTTGVMIDLNHFKSINDEYGHEVGDEALINTAEILVRNIGGLGKVIRYAGDEFVLVIKTGNQFDVARIMGKINLDLEEFNEKHPDKYRLSISFGYLPVDLKTQSIDEFMNAIDAKMYDDKRKYHKNED